MFCWAKHGISCCAWGLYCYHGYVSFYVINRMRQAEHVDQQKICETNNRLHQKKYPVTVGVSVCFGGKGRCGRFHIHQLHQVSRVWHWQSIGVGPLRKRWGFFLFPFLITNFLVCSLFLHPSLLSYEL